MKLNRLTVIVLGAVAGIWWAVEKNTTAGLQPRVQDIAATNAEIARLRREHDRLMQLQTTATELERLRRSAIAPERGGAMPLSTYPASGAPRMGTWMPASDWIYRGRSTPEAALETVLWAAADGNTQALKETFEIDETVRSKAEMLWARLPEQSRRQYPTVEDLVALFVARDVPMESAQVAARQQHDPEMATEYVRFRNADGKTRPVYLSFHRRPDGWRLVVPAAVLDNIASELAGGSLQ